MPQTLNPDNMGLSTASRARAVVGLCTLAFILSFFASGVIHGADEDFSYFPCPFKEDRPHGKWGYMDRAGKVVISPVYNDAFTFRDGLARVAGNNWKVGFIDVNGKMVIAPTFDDVTDFHDGMAQFTVSTGGGQTKSGYVDKKGRVVPPNFNTGFQFSEGLAAVSPDGKKWGFIDKTGKFVIEPMFQGEGSFSEGLAAVSPDGKKWGFIDKTGKFVIEPSIDGACGKTVLKFDEGLFCAKTDNREGFINRQGKMVIDTSGFLIAEEFHEGLAAAVPGEGDSHVQYIDKTGKPVIDLPINTAGGFSGPFTKDGVAKICSSFDQESYGGCGFIDRKGKFVIAPTLKSDSY